MLALVIATSFTAVAISAYFLGISVDDARATTAHLDEQARRLRLPPYDLQEH